MKHKIFFLTPARYPTEKAYGVTTGNTVLALGRLDVEIEIWNRDNFGIDEYGNLLVQPGKKKGSKRRCLYRIGYLGISRWAYLFDQIKFSINCLTALRKESRNAVAWTRFPLVGLITSFAPKIRLVIIELHHQPKCLEQIIIKVLRLIKPVSVALISRNAEALFNELGLDVPTLVLEMAVPDEFILNQEVPLPSPLKICFLGKSKSSGKSNNLEFVIEAFSQIRNLEELKLELIGVEEDSMRTLSQLIASKKIPENRVIFTPHLIHSKVNEFLDSVSIGLVPYELNKYNAGRFPIKIMEYAAKGIWILAPEKFANNLGLQPNIVICYKDGDASDLAQQLDILSREIVTARTRNQSAIQYAKLHTYSARALKVVTHLDKLSYKPGP